MYKDNLNRVYKRVKANKGAEGIDGMTVKEALVYLKEHGQELTDRIYRGKYTPSPVRPPRYRKQMVVCESLAYPRFLHTAHLPTMFLNATLAITKVAGFRLKSYV